MAFHPALSFHSWGHGSQIRDRDGDELKDGLEEIIPIMCFFPGAGIIRLRRMLISVEMKERSNNLSGVIVAAAIEVHRHLGPGLLESSYEQAFGHELSLRKIFFERQKLIPVEYKGVQLDAGYRLDLLVEDLVIVELKAGEKMMPLFDAQVLTYLKSSKLWLGMFINFNVPVMKDGIKRIVN